MSNDTARSLFHCAKLRVRRGLKHEAADYLRFALAALDRGPYHPRFVECRGGAR